MVGRKVVAEGKSIVRGNGSFSYSLLKVHQGAQYKALFYLATYEDCSCNNVSMKLVFVA